MKVCEMIVQALQSTYPGSVITCRECGDGIIDINIRLPVEKITFTVAQDEEESGDVD